MSVDVLQDKIRKLKNPSLVLFEADPELVPPCFLEGVEVLPAVKNYFTLILESLRGIVPAVRFGFGSFALWGAEGVTALQALMSTARKLGYYVLLDLPEILTPATVATKIILEDRERFPCHGYVISSYLGSDVLQPMKAFCKDGVSVFAVARTANKSAVELQDLLTGGRLVHIAAVDIISRHGESVVGKYGYSQLGAVAAASNAGSLKTLRAKYSRVFLLLDGMDYSGSNAKNCSFAFDRLGHGAVACAGRSILGAWQEGEGEPSELAVQAAERMKKNLCRYVTIL